MFRKSVAAASVGLLIFTSLAQAHPLPPPPAPKPIPHHHMHHGHAGLSVGTAAGLLTAFMLICAFPAVMSEERKKRDAKWARHVDVLPCGWDVVLAEQAAPVTEVVYSPAPRKSRLVCTKGGTVQNGGCTRY